MTQFLIKKLSAKAGEKPAAVRDRLGKAAAVVGIVSNLLLAAFKLLAGLLSGSIAITADAVNNFSDCASSLITLFGFQFAALPADEQHPYGHARIEYLSGLAVAVLVLLIGFEFLKSSIAKIITPEPVEFSLIVFIVLAVSIAIKLWQGLFNKAVGKQIDSTALVATAADSRNDAITTSTVLVGALTAHFTGLNLDGWMGALVAGFVLFSGVKLIFETVNPLLGTAPDEAMVERIQRRILEYPSVIGLHDLMVHNYGPGRCFASVHVEVPASQDILISHDIIDNIERDFARRMDIHLVIHLDPIDTDDAYTETLRKMTEEVVAEYDPALSMHDFRVVRGKTHTNLIFDVVAPPRYKYSDARLSRELSDLIRARSDEHDCHCVITVDRSYTSTTQSMRKQL